MKKILFFLFLLTNTSLLHPSGAVSIEPWRYWVVAYELPANNIIKFYHAHTAICEKACHGQPLTPSDFAELKKSTTYIAEDFKRDYVGFMKDLKKSLAYFEKHHDVVIEEIGEEKARIFKNGLEMLQRIEALLPKSFKRKPKATKSPVPSQESDVKGAALASDEISVSEGEETDPSQKTASSQTAPAMDLSPANTVTAQEVPKASPTKKRKAENAVDGDARKVNKRLC